MIRSIWTAIFAFAVAAPFADAGQTWTFDVTTTGQNVAWNSPTAVDPTASVYATDYTITLVEVDVTWNGIPFNNLNVTNQVPPELQSAYLEVPGPAPISTLNQQIVVPPPPTAPAFSANLSIGLNATGFGFANATNVTLGNLAIDLGGIFGTQTVTLKSVRLVGQLAIHGAWFDLGNGKAGTTGTPLFVGSGSLVPGDVMKLNLSGAAPSSSAILVIGVSTINAPFFGGTMVPALNVILPIATNPLGGFELAAVWPNNIPANTSLYMQTWIINSTSTGINGGSNALRAVAQ